MPWIETVSEEQATGPLARDYEAARTRAGWVWNIVKLMSPNPATLRASMTLYTSSVFGSSPLTRVQREMLAVVVSQANGCFYCTEAHAYDLHAEADEPTARGVKADWRSLDLDAVTRALLEFAEKLTQRPDLVVRADIEGLRRKGLSDRAIHDAVQVIAYFNYVNRVANGLGVDLEEWMRPDEPG